MDGNPRQHGVCGLSNRAIVGLSISTKKPGMSVAPVRISMVSHPHWIRLREAMSPYFRHFEAHTSPSLSRIPAVLWERTAAHLGTLFGAFTLDLENLME